MLSLTIGAPDEGMGWLKWSAELVHSLAWPAAAVAIAIIFHSQIAGLLSKVRKLSWGDKVADFAGELDKLEAISRVEPNIPADEAQPRRAEEDDRFERLLAFSPEAAILDAWSPIEMLIDELASEDVGSTASPSAPAFPSRHAGPGPKISYLQKREVITPSIATMLRELRNLRNRAAHQSANEPLTIADAYRFKQLADDMLRVLGRHFGIQD